jgi:tetratricopeptide (TPR) repeat protein
VSITSYPPEVTQAIDLYRAGELQESHDCLRDFLLQQPAHLDALLWLAKVTPDHQEAIAAAELALKLDPGNEIAQRAVIAVRERAEESAEQAAEQAELSAAVALSTGMTLAQARAVKWPFRGVNRPIGEVLDDRTIALRDLGWAVEEAWDTQVKDAAKTILLTHLVGAEPDELPLPLKVIVASRFSELQERRNLVYFAALSGASLLLLSELGILTVGSLVLKWNWPIWVSLVLFAVIGFLVGAARFTDRYRDLADQYRLGRWGEEKVVDALRYSLDGRWTLFHNFEWPNRRWGDMDLVLVGPGGVWVFEVKAYSTRVRNIGDRWERRSGRGWRKLTTHPGHQARRNAARLKEYLKSHSVDVRWVEPAVVWAGEPGSLAVEDPATPVWNLEELSDHAEELWQSRSLPEEAVQQVVGVLERVIQTAQEQG